MDPNVYQGEVHKSQVGLNEEDDQTIPSSADQVESPITKQLEVETDPDVDTKKRKTDESKSTQGQSDDECDDIFFNDPTLEEVGSMRYQQFRVYIFRKKTDGKADMFYYEPLILLNPKDIKSSVCQVTGKAEVNLTVGLWNGCVQDRIVQFLRQEVGESDLKAYQVSVMPYEEVKLVRIGDSGDGHPSKDLFQLPDQPRSILQSPEVVEFDLLCSSPEAADKLTAEPKYLVKCLGMEFKSPASRPAVHGRIRDHPTGLYHGSSSGVKRCCIFEFNVLKNSEANAGHRMEIEEMLKAVTPLQYGLQVLEKDHQSFREELAQLNESFKANKPVVPVFAVSRAVQRTAPNCVTFEHADFETDKTHGLMDKDSGQFTVATKGTYLLQFQGVATLLDTVATEVALRVNGVFKAHSFSQGAIPSTSSTYGYGFVTSDTQQGFASAAGTPSGLFIPRKPQSLLGPVAVSSMLPLEVGDRVEVMIKSGSLYESAPGVGYSRFFGLLISY